MLPLWIKRFGFNEVDLVPESPGVYAWYPKIQAGLADWRKDIDEATLVDLGESNLKKLLLRHSVKYDPPEYAIKAKSNFELEWIGDLKPQMARSFDKYLKSDKEEDWGIDDKNKLKNLKKIHKPFKKEKSRSFIVKILDECNPFFSSPIYIGKSDQLQRRLKEHASEIKKFSRALSADPEGRSKLIEHVRGTEANFAARVTALGFAPEQLEVFVFDFNELIGGECTPNELEELACTVEWLLNRWHRPIAGRI